MKKWTARVLALFFFILLPQGLQAFQDAQSGFGGIEWGTRVDELDEMVLLKDEGDFGFYARRDDESVFEGVAAEGVLYLFHKERFCAAGIFFSGYANFGELRKSCTDSHGDPYQPKRHRHDYWWQVGEDAGAMIHYETGPDRGMLLFYYIPILQETQAPEKKKASRKSFVIVPMIAGKVLSGFPSILEGGR